VRRFGASDSDVTETAGEFYRLLVVRRFEPISPTLMNG
jgi:ribonucleotide reductase alpha subunit